MDIKTEALCESIQCVSLAAWPVLYGDDNPYDEDSFELLWILRRWGEEFQKKWDEELSGGYSSFYELVDEFTDEKVVAYLRSCGLSDDDINARFDSVRRQYLL